MKKMENQNPTTAPLSGQFDWRCQVLISKVENWSKWKMNTTFYYKKTSTTPTFCKRNFSRMHDIGDMIFFSFPTFIGNHCFGSKGYSFWNWHSNHSKSDEFARKKSIIIHDLNQCQKLPCIILVTSTNFILKRIS